MRAKKKMDKTTEKRGEILPNISSVNRYKILLVISYY